MEAAVESLLVDAPPLSPDTTGEAAYEIFSQDENLLVCAVIEHGKPVGLLNRDRFFLKMADRYGRALYSRRPLSFVMQTDPLIVPAQTPISRLNAHILESRPAALMDGFIVVNADQSYAGVGTTFAMFSAAVQETEARAMELERLTGDLRAARERALESARVKSEFLATMSHEIRTPLNGVLGLSAVLTRTGLEPEQEKLARTIHESGETLLALLNDILDLSRMEAGHAELSPEAFSVRALCDHARSFWTARAAESQLALHVDCTGPLDALEGDIGRIKQVLSNLIGNALKFTHEGEVRVTLSTMRSSAPGQARLRCEVADTGIGVPEAAQAKIFEAFSQADSTHTRRYGGTGLGLSICKRLVDMMGGEIGFENRAGGGSVFWFDIPLQAQSAPAAGTRKLTAQSA